ncbi:MAG: hypothetical protein ACI4EI_13110 [Muricoprocola sp.]
METITKRQKLFLTKWTVIAGLVCGLLTVLVLLLKGTCTAGESVFWFYFMIMAAGGGILFGLIPATLVEYNRQERE